jgi:hypothetical protein
MSSLLRAWDMSCPREVEASHFTNGAHMNKEQFQQFWEQLKAPLKAKWAGISDKDLVEIEGNLDTFRTILSNRYGDLRKEEVLTWAHQRYCHWSGNYIDYK